MSRAFRNIGDRIFLSLNRGQQVQKGKKCTIVGIGSVGMACAYSLLNQNVVTELCLIDVLVEKIQGEVLDLQHGVAASSVSCTQIIGGTDFALSANSDIIVITAGVRQRPKETRLDLLQRNKSVVKDIVTQVVKHSPNSILLIVTNPVDVMTYLAWKTSGFSPSRVFGTGTSLDTCRFRNMLAQELGGLNPADIHADIIGEHGDKQIPVWSTANINGMCLRDLANGMDLKEEQLGNAVRNAAYEVISLKGYTNWGIGFVVCSIVQAVLNDRRSIWNVSVMTPAVYSSSPAVHPKTKETQENVFLSLPCVLGSRGVHSVLQLSLDSSENKAFQSLRAQMLAIQSKL